jgi:hypothetical protein
MNKEWVHLIASIFWGIYGLSVGTIGVVYNDFNLYVMVSIVTAIVGNSAHLISMSYSKGNLQVEASK